MAIVSVVEDFQGREAREDESSRRQYTRVFKVTTSTLNDDEETIIAATGIPRKYDSHPSYSPALAKSIRSLQTRDGYLWLVTVEYDTFTVDPTQQHANPLLRPAEVEWSTDTQMRAVTEDADDNAIVNSAGEAFDPPVEEEYPTLTLTISRNELAFDPVARGVYVAALNSDTFYGFPEYQVMCVGISATRQFEANFVFWKVIYRFRFATSNDWRHRILDAGFNARVGNNLEPIRAADGSPLANPALLDGAGAQLANNADPVFLTFSRFSLPFADLGLE